MKRYRQHWCWKFALGSWLVMGSAIGEAVLQIFAFSFNCAFAQITPDSTLPNNSRVTTQDNISTIEGGTQAGRNLFHSFEQFSVPRGGTAIFNNAGNIQNIISRVTGGSASNIDGIIRANGTANLFLINPNGIIFGQNAQLNIGGSFVASTANALQFGNIGFFNASDKNIPSPLLTINPSALLFNQINQNAAIQNNSIAFAGKDPAGFDAFGLRVPDGKSLLLAGGNVSMDGGQLNAYSGRVELGGLAQAGSVGLGVDGDNLSLIFPENVARTSVSLTNQAAIYVEGSGGGDIGVNARNLEILEGTVLSAGIGEGLGTSETVAGDITLNATGEIKVTGGSDVRNLVGLGSKGNGGNITIDSGSFSLRDGALLDASTFGQGNAGNVTVRAQDAVSLADNAYIFSTVEVGGVGKGGNIDINAATLSLIDGALLDASTFGQGNAGNVTVRTQDAVSLADADIFSTVEAGGVGKGGNIDINAATLSLIDGALLNASTFGEGKSGGIRITADSIFLSNGAQLEATTYGKGDGGSVIIDARKSVSFDGVRDSLYPSAAFGGVGEGGEGKGGGIYINTGELSLTNGAQLQASTGGIGDGGSVIINASKSVSFDGVIIGKFYTFNSYAASRVYSNAEGKGGNIHITTGELSLTNGAQVFADTAGKGDAGNIQINAKNSVSVSGTSLISGSSSALFTFTNSTDKGGNIIVDTNAFRTLDGGVLNAQTFNDGDGGSITVRAKLVEILNGGQLLATSSGNGRAGKITINATDQVIVNGSDATYLNRVEKFGTKVANAFGTKGVNNINADSGLFVRSESLGSAGDIEVISPQIRLDNSGRFIAESASGNGGNIILPVRDILLLRRGSLISTNAGKAQQGGNGGNIIINAPSGFIVAVPSENSDITANAYTGSGGRVNIRAIGIYGIQPRSNPTSLSDITASSEFGVNGTVELNTPDIDPNSGLVNLPTIPVNTQVAQTCTAGSAVAKSSFTITGRGGLPPNPGEALNADAVQVDLVALNPEGGKPSTRTVSTNPINPTPDPIVEATGWVIAANGDVILTNSAPTLTPHSSWQNPADCGVLNQHQGG